MGMAVLQIVTTGTDRKIAYWDAYDGSAVRVVDASEDSAMCDVHVDCEGDALVSGSADSRVLVRFLTFCISLPEQFLSSSWSVSTSALLPVQRLSRGLIPMHVSHHLPQLAAACARHLRSEGGCR